MHPHIKNNKIRTMKYGYKLVAIGMLLIHVLAIQAQDLILPDELSNAIVEEAIDNYPYGFKGFNGEALTLRDVLRHPEQYHLIGKTECVEGENFHVQLDYYDEDNFGFLDHDLVDDSSSPYFGLEIGAVRRAVLHQVLKDYSALIETSVSPASDCFKELLCDVQPCFEDGKPILLLKIRTSETIFFSALGEVVGSAGTEFVPQNPNPIHYGNVWRKLHGESGLLLFPVSNIPVYDGSIHINFEAFPNMELDPMEPMDPTVPNLYQTLAHEFMHTLGMSTGLTVFGGFATTTGGFRVYDQYLTYEGSSLIDIDNGSISGGAESLTGDCPSDVFFETMTGEELPVFLSSPFAPGSSIAHFASCQNPGTHMMEAAVNEVRAPGEPEVMVLATMGYHTTGAFGMPVIEPLTLTNSTLSFHTTSLPVLEKNLYLPSQKLSLACDYSFETCKDESLLLTMTELIPGTYPGAQIVNVDSNGGQATLTNQGIAFSSSEPGLFQIGYSLITAEGELTNFANIYINVNRCGSLNCPEVPSCNLICNPIAYDNGACAEALNQQNSLHGHCNDFPGWSSHWGTPGYFSEDQIEAGNATDPGFLFLGAGGPVCNCDGYTESVYTIVEVEPEKEYILSIQAAAEYQNCELHTELINTGYMLGQLDFAFPGTFCAEEIPLDQKQSIGSHSLINGEGFTQYTSCFSSGFDQAYLHLYPLSFTSAAAHIDHVDLFEHPFSSVDLVTEIEASCQEEQSITLELPEVCLPHAWTLQWYLEVADDSWLEMPNTSSTAVVEPTQASYKACLLIDGELPLDEADCNYCRYFHVSTIDPEEAVITNDFSEDICVLTGPIQLIANPLGGTFTGPGVVGTSFDPSLALSTGLSAPYVIQYQHPDECVSGTSISVTVLHLTTAEIATTQTSFCSTEGAVVLEAFPAGGAFTGPGVTGSSFDPAAALSTGSGPYEISYVLPDACTEAATILLEVQDYQSADFTLPNESYCFDGIPIWIPIENFDSGQWTIEPGIGTSQQANGYLISQVGDYSITHSYEGICANQHIEQVSIAEVEASIVGLEAAYCPEDAAVPLVGEPVGGSFLVNGLAVEQFEPEFFGSGQYLILYQGTIDGCSFEANTTVTVLDAEPVDLAFEESYCMASLPFIVEIPAGTPAGTWSFPNCVDCYAANGHLYLEQFGPVAIALDPDATCSQSANTTIVLEQLEEISFNDLPSSVCADTAPFSLHASPDGGVFSINGQVLSSFDPTQYSGIVEILYDYATNSLCPQQASTQLTVTDQANSTFAIQAVANCLVEPQLVSLLPEMPGGVFALSFEGSTELLSGNSFTAAQSGVYEITYSFEGECGSSTTHSIEFTEAAQVTIDLPSNFCAGQTAIPLPPQDYAGEYHLAGQIISILDVNLLAPGQYTLSFIPMEPCVIGASMDIQIGQSINTAFTADVLYDCETSTSSVQLQATATGGYWNSAPGGLQLTLTGPNTALISDVPAGEYQITYSLEGDCAAEASTQTIVIEEMPEIEIQELAPSYCQLDAAIALLPEPGLSYFLDGAETLAFDPALLDIGLHSLSYTYTGSIEDCQESGEQIVEVLGSLSTDFEVEVQYDCGSSNAQVLLSPSVLGGVWSSDDPSIVFNSSEGQTSIAVPNAGTYEINYSHASACSEAANSQTVQVEAIPAIPVQVLDNQYCQLDPVVVLTAAQGLQYYLDHLPVSVFDPSSLTVGQHYLSHSYDTGIADCFIEGGQTIEILEPVLASFNLSQTEVCIGQEPVVIEVQAEQGPGQWLLNGEPIVLLNNELIIAEPGVYEIAYRLETDCQIETLQSITVEQLPEIILPEQVFVCPDQSSFDLSTVVPIPSIGNWSGDAVQEDLAILDGNDLTVTYTVSEGICTASEEMTIVQQSSVNSGVQLPESLCPDEGLYELPNPQTGTWTGIGVSSVAGNWYLDPASGNAGELSYDFVVGNPSCSFTESFSLDIVPEPLIDLTAPGVVCVDDGIITLAAEPPGGWWSGPGILDAQAGIFDPTSLQGAVELSYMLSYSGCESVATITLSVFEPDPIELPDLGPICLGAEEAINLTAEPAGGVWSGEAVIDNMFYPDMVAIPNDLVILQYQYTDVDSGCEASTSMEIHITPTVEAPELYFECKQGQNPPSVSIDEIDLPEDHSIAWYLDGLLLTDQSDAQIFHPEAGVYTAVIEAEGCQSGTAYPIEVLSEWLDPPAGYTNEACCLSGRNWLVNCEATPLKFEDLSETWNPEHNPFLSTGGATISIDEDLVFGSGCQLLLKDLNFEFGPKGRVIIEQGAQLSLLNCSFKGACNNMWQGIQVHGPGKEVPRIETVDGLPLNYGSLSIRSNTSIEQAVIGVVAMQIDLIDFSQAYSSYANPVEATYTAQILEPYIGPGNHDLPGGFIDVQGAQFIDCFQGINLSYYDNRPQSGVLEVPNSIGSGQVDALGNASNYFISNNSLAYPFDGDGIYMQEGIYVRMYTGIEIKGNYFQGLQYGLRLNEVFLDAEFSLSDYALTVPVRYNRFEACEVGLSVQNVHTDFEGQIISHNQFINNHQVGLQANGAKLRLYQNLFQGDYTIPEVTEGAPQVGVFIRGSEFVIKDGNQFEDLPFGIIAVNNSLEGSYIESNDFHHLLYGIYAVGDNMGVSIRCNTFSDYLSAIVMNDFKEHGELITAGKMADFGSSTSPLSGTANIFEAPGGLDLVNYCSSSLVINYTLLPNFEGNPTDVSTGINLVSIAGGSPECDSGYDGTALIAGSIDNEDKILNEQLLDLRDERNLTASLHLLSQQDTKTSLRQEVRYLLYESKPEDAEVLLQDRILVEDEEDQNYKIIFGLLSRLDKEQRGLLDLTDAELQEIEAIAHSDSKTAHQAKAWLYLIKGQEVSCRYPDLPEEIVDQVFVFKQADKDDSRFSQVYPNPSDNSCHLDYRLAPSSRALMEVFDMEGNSHADFELKGSGTLKFSSVAWPKGIYVYTIRQNDYILQRGKIFVN